MEKNFTQDIGEEIISKLKELIHIIEESKDNHGKKFTTTSIPGN
jgi:hypothetical protein